MTQEFNYSDATPATVQVLGSKSNLFYLVSFDTEKLTGTDSEGNETESYKSAFVKVSDLDYSTLMDAIVRSKYSASDIEAILLNYQQMSITDADKKTEYQNEYDALQSWRAHAKEIAAANASDVKTATT